MSNWKKYKLGDLVSVNESVVSKDTEWINYIDIKSVSNGYFEVPKLLKLKEAPSRARRLLRNGDTVISSVRPYLKAFFYANKLKENTIASTGFAVITPKKIDSRFLYYLTTNNNYIQFLTNSCVGSAYPAFNSKVIEISEVLIPENINEQHRIAEILGALDDKIELNQQMNKTLEEMAMALYKHWFVDFDPFRDGEFVESKLGPIPKWWKVELLNNVVRIGKKSIKPFEYPNKAFLHYSIPAFDDFSYPKTELGKEIASNKTVIELDTILISKLNPRIKRIWTVYKNDSYISFTSTEFINYTLLDQDNWAFLNCFFRNGEFYNEFLTYATGTTGSRQRVKPQETLKFQLLYPSKTIRKNFNKIVKNYFDQIESNIIENQTLTQTRDYLLPKLISGEVEVKVAKEKIKKSFKT
jgi:type I restriction enzyme S subunit